MSNRNPPGTGTQILLSVAKPVIYVLLFTILILWNTPLLAQQGSGNGPGPHHRNHGQEHHGGHVGDNIYGAKNLAYYGDWDSNRVFIIDIDNWVLLPTVEGTGDGPYGVDQQNWKKAYALTRKTESLTIIDNYTIENAGFILLDHKPRSTNYKPHTGLSLVSGADMAKTSIIEVETDSVVSVFGSDDLTPPYDYGGSLATGHPLWVNNERFFMLDRPGRQIQLWSRNHGLISVLDTPTSVHHVFQSPLDSMTHVYYAVVEGNQEELKSPSILKFNIHRGIMTVMDEAVLSDYDLDLNPAYMGSHHADFHPDGVHIYIGSAEGHVFVVNKDSMEIVTMIDTGSGSGHTTFAPMFNRAFVTNHNDTFMTVINTLDHTFVKNIEVALEADPTYKSQAHTSSVSPDGAFFYSAASHDGVFFEINIEALEVSNRLIIGDGANILMGSFIWDGDSDNGGM